MESSVNQPDILASPRADNFFFVSQRISNGAPTQSQISKHRLLGVAICVLCEPSMGTL